MKEEVQDWSNEVGDGDTLSVRVIPKSSSNRIKAERMADGILRLRVYVTLVAEGGKANAAVLKLLAKALGRPKSALSIIRGELSQDKKIMVNG